MLAQAQQSAAAGGARFEMEFGCQPLCSTAFSQLRSPHFQMLAVLMETVFVSLSHNHGSVAALPCR